MEEGLNGAFSLEDIPEVANATRIHREGNDREEIFATIYVRFPRDILKARQADQIPWSFRYRQ